MRRFLLLLALAALAYGCTEILAREKESNAPAKAKTPDELADFRVGRAEATNMRTRRGKDKDDASLKISAADLMALMNNAQPAAGDSFILYFVKYDASSPGDRARYQRKVKDANWGQIQKKASSVLVGFVPANGAQQGMFLTRPRLRNQVSVYDLAVLCPPPPDCDCDIAQ